MVNYASSSAAAEEVAAAIAGLGGEAMIVGANVGKREEIDKLFKAVVDKWGRVDVLVNNAGAWVAGVGKRGRAAGWVSGGLGRYGGGGGAGLGRQAGA